MPKCVFMPNQVLSSFLYRAELSMQRDAAELLYKNSFSGILISAIASSALVFGFESPGHSFFQHVWLSIIFLVLGFIALV